MRFYGEAIDYSKHLKEIQSISRDYVVLCTMSSRYTCLILARAVWKSCLTVGSFVLLDRYSRGNLYESWRTKVREVFERLACYLLVYPPKNPVLRFLAISLKHVHPFDSKLRNTIALLNSRGYLERMGAAVFFPTSLLFTDLLFLKGSYISANWSQTGEFRIFPYHPLDEFSQRQ